MLLALAAGTVVRVQGLGDALNHDEVHTWEAFASKPFATIVTYYPVPNNHIFHSILVRLASLLFGQSETALRTPAFVAGLLSIPTMWALARMLLRSSTAGVAAAWILALAPMHVRYSASARGYSIMVLLSMLALLFLWYAMAAQNRSGRFHQLWWVGWSTSAFLIVYTVPSSALFVIAVVAWALVDSLRHGVEGSTQRLVPLLLSSGIASIGLVAALWPIRAELSKAGAQWGVDLTATPLALVSLVSQTMALVTGGWPGVALGLAAVGGGMMMMAKGHDGGLGRLPLLLMLILLLPFAISFIYGTAPQARGFVFLLPVVILFGSYSVSQLASRSLRVGAMVAIVAGQVLGGGLGSGWGTVSEGCRALGNELTGGRQQNEVVVTPYIMDLELWYYAKEAIQNGLVTAAINGRLDRVVFATDKVDARFGLDSYQLSAETTGNRLDLVLPRNSFEEVFAAGTKSLFALRGKGTRVLDHPLTWQAQGTQQLQITNAASALSDVPAIEVRHSSTTGGYRLYSQDQFISPDPGLAVLLCARSDQSSEVSLYLAVDVEGGNWRPAELHMCVTAAKPVKVVGRDEQLWYVEAFILPVLANRKYGLYIRGGDRAVQSYAEMAIYHFPWRGSDEL